ncbi:hypothetical protein [Biostraticola tofi]|uniref:LysE type translocator n=1 Tax=Biostraticola tofi TaxID=466109 RepID=A0A4R3Z8Q3_9GAMM|nr:hypothetical protein EDC52_101827 [Biostraticola tofi]
MVISSQILPFAAIALGLVLTPGPNMIYLISRSLNAMNALSAGSIAQRLNGRPLWWVIQRWLMGTVLAGLAIRMLAESRR